MTEHHEEYVAHHEMVRLAQRIVELERRLKRVASAQGDLRHSAIDHGASIPIKDAEGNVTAVLGGHDEPLHHVGGPDPVQPEPPFVDTGGENVKIQHSGFDINNDRAPSNFRRARIYVSRETGFEPGPETFAAYMEEADGSVTHRLPGGEWYVGVVWETRSGKLSPMSETVLADVAPLVDAQDIEDTLAEAEQIIADAVAVAQTQLDELRDRLDNFEGFDPTDLIAQINQVTEDLATARQEATGMVADLADRVDDIKIPDVSGFITQAEVDAAAAAAETAAKEHADLVAQGAKDDAIAEAEAKANKAREDAEAAANEYADRQDAQVKIDAAQDAQEKADAAQAEAERLAAEHAELVATGAKDDAIAEAERLHALAVAEAQAAKTRADEAHTEAGTAWDHADAALTRAVNAETNAKQHADNMPKMLGGTGGPVGTAPDGSVWFQRDSNNTVIGRWERINGSWVQQEVSGQLIDNLEAGKITALNTEFAESVIGKLWTQLAIVDRLIATSAWIGGAMIGEDAVEAKHIVASESLSAKVAEFLKLSVADLTAGTADIDDAVVNKFWSALAVIERLRAAEAWVTGDLVVGDTIRTRHLHVTQEMVGEFAKFMHLVVDQMDVNKLWADSTWQAAGHFGSDSADQSTLVDGTGLRITRHDHDNDTSTDLVRLGGEGIGLTFFDENGRPAGSLSHEGDAALHDVAAETLSVAGRPIQDPECHDYTHPSGNQSLITWRPRGLVGYGSANLPTGLDADYRELGFLESSAQLYADRAYRITVTPFMLTGANSNTNYLRVRYTTDGSVPDTTSPIAHVNRTTISGAHGDVEFFGDFIFTPDVSSRHRFLVCPYVHAGIRTNYSNQGAANLIIEDVGSAIPDGTVIREALGSHANGLPDVVGPVHSHDSITTEWHAHWFQNYSHGGTRRTTNPGSSGGFGSGGPAQGQRQTHPEEGIWRSIIEFGNSGISTDPADIGKSLQQALAGNTIQSITFEFRSAGTHYWRNWTNYAIVATPFLTSPSQFTTQGSHIVGGFRISVGETARLSIPVAQFGAMLKSGDFRSIGLRTASAFTHYQGWLDWPGVRPKLIISYTKEGN